jgi:hypothetical protein
MKNNKLFYILWTTSFIIAILIYSCSVPSESLNNYYGVRIGAEDDVHILNISLDETSHRISNTIYFLTPLLDNMKREEYLSGADLSKLFLRYQRRPILLKDSYFVSDSIRFTSSSYTYDDDNIKFSYSGKIKADSIKGFLISSRYIARLGRDFLDTSRVKFIRLR